MSFLLLGLYHGGGIVIWQLFQKLKKQVPFLAKMFSYKLTFALCVCLNVHFISTGTVFFGFEVEHAFLLLKTIYAGG